jgi:hypothetical protein
MRRELLRTTATLEALWRTAASTGLSVPKVPARRPRVFTPMARA